MIWRPIPVDFDAVRRGYYIKIVSFGCLYSEMTEAKPDEQAILEGWNLGRYKHTDPLAICVPCIVTLRWHSGRFSLARSMPVGGTPNPGISELVHM